MFQNATQLVWFRAAKAVYIAVLSQVPSVRQYSVYIFKPRIFVIINVSTVDMITEILMHKFQQLKSILCLAVHVLYIYIYLFFFSLHSMDMSIHLKNSALIIITIFFLYLFVYSALLSLIDNAASRYIHWTVYSKRIIVCYTIHEYLSNKRI